MRSVFGVATGARGVRVGNRRRIIVSAPRIERRDNATRVTALVDGVPLWFESRDATLVPAPEAFGSALLLASQHRARTLVFESPVSAVWLANVAQLLDIWKEWWGYDVRMPEAEPFADGRSPAPGSALLFSGGVDSFYSLHAGTRPDYLVSVHGFDILPGDTIRMVRLRNTMQAAALARGCGAIMISTNARQHPALGRPHLWERGHGGPLAAIGHLLSDTVGRLVISSSWPVSHEVPWGSTSRTDPLFASNRVTVDYFGGEARREDKFAAIAVDPLVQRHLRVCWQNKRATGNCSSCEKCVMAMLHLTELGVLQDFEVFEGAEKLDKRLRSLPLLRHHMDVAERMLQRGKLDPRLSKGLGALVNRSRRAAPIVAYRSRLRDVVDRYA